MALVGLQLFTIHSQHPLAGLRHVDWYMMMKVVSACSTQLTLLTELKVCSERGADDKLETSVRLLYTDNLSKAVSISGLVLNKKICQTSIRDRQFSYHTA
ncbi:hypothetical protein NUBL17187_44420 [Klebsiella michiganensis]|nr:hypothetical protein NUBL17187_44420 [Klebsiella michiganensis]